MLSVLMEISSLFGALLGVFFLSHSQLYYRSFKASFCVLDYWKTVAERDKNCPTLNVVKFVDDERGGEDDDDRRQRVL